MIRQSKRTMSWMLAVAIAVSGASILRAEAPTSQPSTAPATQPTTTPAALPTGHMPIGGMHAGGGGITKRPTSGALRVLVSQGTKGGPAIGAEPAVVELLVAGKVIKTYETRLSDKGVLEIKDLPLDKAFQPVVTIKHAGSEQQLIGAPMHMYQPAVETEMKVYEVTEEKPAWTMGIRQASVQAEKKDGVVGLRVIEMLGVHNPTDRAWLGAVGEKKDRQTLVIALPAGAEDVQFGPGMLEAGAHVENGAIVRGKTMLPGAQEHVFAYFVPAEEGKATLTFKAPANTTLFAVYLPADVKVEKATGVNAGKAGGEHGSAKAQLLKNNNVKEGTETVIEISNITAPKPKTIPASAPATQK